VRLTLAQARRDLTVAFRTRGETANPVAFFVLVVVLFAIGIGPDLDTMSEVGPGVVWVLALLSTMMAMEGLFRRDFEDGSLEQMLLHSRPLFLAVLGKLIAHWCVSGLALTLISPVAAFMLQVPVPAMPTLALSLALGTPTLILIGAIASALTVGLGRGGLLVALIALPLYIPVLIFGASASLAAASGMDPRPQLIWLAAMLAAAITLAPFVVSLSLKVSQEY
jgi:heme exporter protein B